MEETTVKNKEGRSSREQIKTSDHDTGLTPEKGDGKREERVQTVRFWSDL